MTFTEEDRKLLRILDEKLGELLEYTEIVIDPWWRRWGYWLNGWPIGKPVPASKQKWRFWHRWWGRRDREY